MIDLIKVSRLARGLTVTKAASLAGMSHQNWSRIEQGRAQSLTPATLAHMANAAGVVSEELAGLGQSEAAAILERIEIDAEREQDRTSSSRPTAAQIARWFRDESVPIEERRRVAERFLDVLPYIMRGQEPPPEARPAHERRDLA